MFISSATFLESNQPRNACSSEEEQLQADQDLLMVKQLVLAYDPSSLFHLSLAKQGLTHFVPALVRWTPNLRFLNISGNPLGRCGLLSLKIRHGNQGWPHLHTLIARDCHFDTLEILDVRQNGIQDLNTFHHVAKKMPNLKTLLLFHKDKQVTAERKWNPVCDQEEYALRIKSIMPNLDRVDFEMFSKRSTRCHLFTRQSSSKGSTEDPYLLQFIERDAASSRRQSLVAAQTFVQRIAREAEAHSKMHRTESEGQSNDDDDADKLVVSLKQEISQTRASFQQYVLSCEKN